MKAALSVRSAPWGGWQLSTVPVCPLTVTGVQTYSAASDARLELKFALFLCGRGSQRAVRCPLWSGIWTAVGPDGMERLAALWGGFEALLSTHGESSFEFRGTCLLKPGAPLLEKQWLHYQACVRRQAENKNTCWLFNVLCLKAFWGRFALWANLLFFVAIMMEARENLHVWRHLLFFSFDPPEIWMPTFFVNIVFCFFDLRKNTLSPHQFHPLVHFRKTIKLV